MKMDQRTLWELVREYKKMDPMELTTDQSALMMLAEMKFTVVAHAKYINQITHELVNSGNTRIKCNYIGGPELRLRLTKDSEDYDGPLKPCYELS